MKMEQATSRTSAAIYKLMEPRYLVQHKLARTVGAKLGIVLTAVERQLRVPVSGNDGCAELFGNPRRQVHLGQRVAVRVVQRVQVATEELEAVGLRKTGSAANSQKSHTRNKTWQSKLVRAV